jgi:hypothetical protein
MPNFTDNGSNFLVSGGPSAPKDDPAHSFMSVNDNAPFRDVSSHLSLVFLVVPVYFSLLLANFSVIASVY